MKRKFVTQSNLSNSLIYQTDFIWIQRNWFEKENLLFGLLSYINEIKSQFTEFAWR